MSTHARIQEFSSGGVQVSLAKKALTMGFFCFVFFFVFFLFCFLVLSLFNRSQMINFQRNLSFFKVPEGGGGGGGGSNFFQGGPIAYSL